MVYVMYSLLTIYILYMYRCFSPSTHVCTNTNFLCPVSAPNACGRACFNGAQYGCAVNNQDWFSSTLFSVSAPAATAITTTSSPTTSGTFVRLHQTINNLLNGMN